LTVEKRKGETRKHEAKRDRDRDRWEILQQQQLKSGVVEQFCGG
jgi:hypothetical protein